MRKLLSLLVVLALSGCGTVFDAIPMGHRERLNIYGGVRFDVEVALEEGQHYLWFDLPFSLVADTVLLPVTVPATVLFELRHR